jgi:D-alanyl-D-alanine carboxypeptidase/D-alanyl-D-alanine-endopeptidase (penicillin-binding protein 4)
MKKGLFCIAAVVVVLQAQAQTVSQKLSTAFSAFEKDGQLKSAIASICVLDAATGNEIFEKNSRIGLAPASTQKVITAATAYEFLGKDFRYETKFGYYGNIKEGKLDGGLYFKPSGDPTLGSWRWPFTTEDAVMNRLLKAVQKTGIKSFHTSILDQRGWEAETIPGGWIWDDVGNYYGAGAGVINWRENQYDLFLKSGPTVQDAVIVVGTKPQLYGVYFRSQVKAAGRGTGDNSYIYLPVGGNLAEVRGTIPYGEERFTISGAIPSPGNQFFSTLHDTLRKNGFSQEWNTVFADNFSKAKLPSSVNYFHTEQSPPLDSIVYWFLKKSINLYGEALAKTMALQKDKTASAAEGSKLIRNYWKEKGLGIDASELNMQDGSGLSPQNRVTTHAQAMVLQYAQKQSWFNGYRAGFPEFNGMKLKSGTIGGAKGFCGYHTSKDGSTYVVSLIVNNYDGSSSSLVQKMYKVLDVLK